MFFKKLLFGRTYSQPISSSNRKLNTMNPFKKASEIPSDRHPQFPPEVQDVLLRHIRTFGAPVTVTSSLVELNKHRLNLSRSAMKGVLDKLAKAGVVKAVKNGNVSDITFILFFT